LRLAVGQAQAISEREANLNFDPAVALRLFVNNGLAAAKVETWRKSTSA
jgi:hypothetical protein